MAKVKVTCEVQTLDNPAKPNIRLHSHWNRQEIVEIQIGDERYEVDGQAMKRAIDNCMNTGRL